MKLELLFYSVLVLDSLPFRFPLVNLFLTHFSAVNTNCKHLSITGDIESRVDADKNSHFVLHRLPFFFGSAAVVCPCHCVNRTACKYAMDNVEIAICLSGALRGCMTLYPRTLERFRCIVCSQKLCFFLPEYRNFVSKVDRHKQWDQ